MKILVVGGAGYIGSQMVAKLIDAGHHPVTFDNLSTGNRDAVLGGEFVQGDLCDEKILNEIFYAYQPEAVMHFASSIQVGESVKRPDIYYRNNLSNTINLLDAMLNHGTKNLIFSSTAAIFGNPDFVGGDGDLINERYQCRPINPYGRSKLMVEQILADYDAAFGLKSVCLRYFNAAGADPEGRIGERHIPETHLIPLVLQVASGRREEIQVFGRDYTTPDGTCVRDYIHVDDLCNAHILALNYLCKFGISERFNLGNGEGFSVQEVIDAAEKITGRKIKVVDLKRREGDPAHLVADASLARAKLGWSPIYSDLETIIYHAWQWEKICRWDMVC